MASEKQIYLLSGPGTVASNDSSGHREKGPKKTECISEDLTEDLILQDLKLEQFKL